MKPISVIQYGFSAVGKRFAEAVRDQPDMTVSAVVESDPVVRERARTMGFSVVASLPPGLSAAANLWVDCRGLRGLIASTPISEDRAHPAPAPLFSRSSKGKPTRLRLPGMDTVALVRLLTGLEGFGPWTRVFATSVGPPDAPTLEWDALRLVTAGGEDAADLEEAFDGVLPEVRIRRVTAPCTQFRLYLMRLDCSRPLDAKAIMQSLDAAPRILLGRAGDGFPHAGAVKEYFRNLGRRRGEHAGLWVWRESVSVRRQTLFLTVNLSLSAGVIPEWIDAARSLGRSSLAEEEARRVTDQSLGLDVLPRDVGRVAS